MKMNPRQCNAALFYPHIDMKSRARDCKPFFMGHENTIFCPRCSAIIAKLRNLKDDPGIEHEDNPYNRPGGRKCRWENCNRQAPVQKQYCSRTCANLRSKAHAKAREKSKAMLENPPKPQGPSYNKAALQRMAAEKMGQAITQILQGQAHFA